MCKGYFNMAWLILIPEPLLGELLLVKTKNYKSVLKEAMLLWNIL